MARRSRRASVDRFAHPLRPKWAWFKAGLHAKPGWRCQGYNGDIGYIDDVDPDAGELTATFDGRAVTYGFGELDTLVPAYAATIHKSQRSEYPAVVIPILTQHYTMLQRNLLHRCDAAAVLIMT
jgi:hypothetical protein